MAHWDVSYYLASAENQKPSSPKESEIAILQQRVLMLERRVKELNRRFDIAK